MTAHEVLERLTPEQRYDIAAICVETMDVEAVWNLVRCGLAEDELLELGLRIKQGVSA
jgi:hypothetical protein